MLCTDPWKEYGQTLTGAKVAVANNGNILAVGVAARRSRDGDPEAPPLRGKKGEVRVYSFDTLIDQWVQLGQTLEGESLDDGFGASLAISTEGDVLTVGAFLFSYDTAYRAGQVRSWAFNSTHWNLLGQPLIGGDGDRFGASVSLSSDGKVLAVGAPENSDNGDKSGQVRYFAYRENKWNQLGVPLLGRAMNGYFGTAVALSADGFILAACAPGNTENGPGAGRTHVLKFDPLREEWGTQGDILRGDAGSDFGASVALSQDGFTVAVGAPFDIPNSTKPGQVEIFRYDAPTVAWNKIGTVKGVRNNDRFGSSLALSGDGNVFAAGAPLYDFGDLISAGHLRIFEYNEENRVWTRKGEVPGREAHDVFGVSVSLSPDGKTVAAGRAVDQDDELDAGGVRTFFYIKPT